MKTYFNIRYEFDKKAVHESIARQLQKNEANYICVADGVILNIANRDPEYLKVVNGGMFSICDSSYVPLYIKWIYGVRFEQYCGSQIFMSRLKPYLHQGVMIAVGAAFKFFSGTEVSRAPQWMIRCHLEFVHRIFKEPRKQLSRCAGILGSLPRLLWQEWRRKRHNAHVAGR